MFKTRVCVWAVPKVRTILVLGIAQRLPVLDTGWYFYWLSYPILIVLRHLDTSSVAVASRWRLVKLERRYNKTRVLGMCGRWQITRCVSVIIPSSHHTIAHNLVVVMTSQSGGAYMGLGGGDAPKRWGIPPDCHRPGTHLWCEWSHQSTVGILLPIFDRREVNVQLSPPQCHSEDRLET